MSSRIIITVLIAYCITNAQIEYCDAFHQPEFEYITNVNIGSIDNTTGHDGYSDFTSMKTNIGQSTNITLTTSYILDEDTVAVFIDWNKDGDFFDEGETALKMPGTEPLTGQIQVPLGYGEGETRMRVRVSYRFAGPCASGNYVGGEAEDYTVNVTWSQPKPLTITTPNEGTVLKANEKINIAWNTVGTVNQVRLQYKIDGSSWINIETNLNNQNQYEWTIPDTSGIFNIRLGTSSGQSYDSSDIPFEVIALTVFSPNGGEIVTVGEQVNIQWGVDRSFTTVHIQYLPGGNRWQLIASDVPNTGEYTWTIPSTPTDQAKVRVISGTGQKQDASDSNFTISSGSSNVNFKTINNSRLILTHNGFILKSTTIFNKVDVKNINGKLINSLLGGNYIEWNGQDKNGVPTPNGVYLIFFFSEKSVQTFLLKKGF